MEAVQQSSLKFHLVQDCVECSYAQIISSLQNHFPSNFQFLFLWRETKMLLFGWISFVEQYLLGFSNRPSVFRFLSCSARRPLCHRNAAAQICTWEVKGLLKRGVCMVAIAGALLGAQLLPEFVGCCRSACQSAYGKAIPASGNVEPSDLSYQTKCFDQNFGQDVFGILRTSGKSRSICIRCWSYMSSW